MFQFESLREEMRELKSMMAYLLQPQSPEVVQLPPGIQLPLETMQEVNDLERLIPEMSGAIL